MWPAIIIIISAVTVPAAFYFVQKNRRKGQGKAKNYDRAYYTIARDANRRKNKNSF